MADQVEELVVSARGHEHVAATHESTLEVTTDDHLTPAGDCIVAIGADLAPADADDALVAAAQDSAATIELKLALGGRDEATPTVTVRGCGHPELTFASDRSLVCRTSSYVDDRTVMVEAAAAAADLDRRLVEGLSRGAPVEATLTVCPGSS